MAKKQITKLSELTPDTNNYNKGTEFGGALIEKSLRKLGAGRSILLDKNGKVIAGNKTIENAVNAGFEDDALIVVQTTGKQIVAVQRMDLDLDSKMGKEMALADNATAKANIEWDTEAIAADWNSEDLAGWGIDGDGWANPSNALNSEAVEDGFEVPDIDEVKTDIVTGDLFEIGAHRLLCGDATDEKSVSVLMDKEFADIVVTDPPYNTGMKAAKNAKARLSQMFNDSFTPDEWRHLKSASFRNYDLFTKGECAFYVFIDWRRVAEFKAELELIADVKNVIVWDKGVHGLGSDYKSTYENIVVGKKGKPEINNRIGLDYQDIWRVQRKIGRDDDHATKKPVALLQKPILHASKKGDIVLDLFGGSGSTMITADQLGRRAYLAEIDPRYCQIIVNRMLTLNPEIEVKKNGVAYAPKS